MIPPLTNYGPDPVAVVAALLSAMPVGDVGLVFGKKTDGTVVDHRDPDVWVVSYRPTGGWGSSRTRHYRSPRDAARAVIEGYHNKYAEEEER